MNKKKLTGKITIVVGAASVIGTGIVRALLTENATVIVASSNAAEITHIKNQTADIAAGGLITLPTDVVDYDKAINIAGTIRQRFGKIDLVVTAFDNDRYPGPLTETEFTDWQKMMDENISLYFTAGRIALQLMKEQDSGAFINVCDADLILHKSCSPLARIATESQLELSLLFSEEIAPFNINYYHLFVNNIDNDRKSPGLTGRPGWVTPEMIGHHLVRLYQGHVDNPEKLFQHYPAIVFNN